MSVYNHNSIVTLKPYFSGEVSYPPEYAPKTVQEQIARLEELGRQFPDIFKIPVHLSSAQKATVQHSATVFPDGAESWFLFPAWFKLFGDYKIAVAKLYGVFRELYGTDSDSCLDGRLAFFHLRESQEKVRAFHTFVARQNSPYVLIPAQFGLKHKNKSQFDLHKEFVGHHFEFGLGLFEILVLLLTHPERIKDTDRSQAIFACGDMFSRTAQQSYSYVPALYWDNGLVVGFADNSHSAGNIMNPTGFHFTKY